MIPIWAVRERPQTLRHIADDDDDDADEDKDEDISVWVVRPRRLVTLALKRAV